MADDIRSGGLAKLDLLIQPGGSGGGQGRHLGEGGRDAIRDFVQDGGGFIGICAGAYLASADYTWSLNILDANQPTPGNDAGAGTNGQVRDRSCETEKKITQGGSTNG
jgi:putative intracellular protease/amidase